MAEEQVRYHHSTTQAGLFVLDARHTERPWRVINPAFGLAVPENWVGRLRYRGRERVFGCGEVFLTEPGEVHVTSEILRPGAFTVFMLEDGLFRDLVGEKLDRYPPLHWRSLGGRMSGRMVARLSAAVRCVRDGSEHIELEQAVVDLVDVVVDEWIDHRAVRPAESALGSRGISRIRERLTEEPGACSLATLARDAGMSRFQLMREFKKTFGLPPHAYQVAHQVSRSQILLHQGWPPADVAAACGFVDQSHFTRHFKRALGSTPARYQQRGHRSSPLLVTSGST